MHLGWRHSGAWDPGSSRGHFQVPGGKNFAGWSCGGTEQKVLDSGAFLLLGECGQALDGHLLSFSFRLTTTRFLTLSESLKRADTQLTCKMGSGWDRKCPPGYF